jgi:hypothetical protein
MAKSTFKLSIPTTVAAKIADATEKSIGEQEHTNEQRVLPVMPEFKDKMTNSEFRLLALSLGQRLAKNDSLVNELEQTVDAKARAKFGPVVLLEKLFQEFGVSFTHKVVEGKVVVPWGDDTQVFKVYPRPNTQNYDKEKENYIDPNGNQPHHLTDKRKIVDITSAGKTVEISFYEDAFEEMDRALGNQSIGQHIKWLTDLTAKEPVMTEGNPYIGQDASYLDSEKIRWKQRHRDSVNQLREAFEIYFKIIELYENFGSIVYVGFVEYIDRSGKKPVRRINLNTNKPLKLTEIETGAQAPFAISSFLSLNPDRAEAAGGAFTDIIASGKKKRQPGAGTGKQKTTLTEDDVRNFNLESFDRSAALMANFFEDDDKSRQLFKLLNKPEDGDALLESVGDLFIKMHTLFIGHGKVSGNALFKRYSRLTNPTGEHDVPKD